MKSIKDVLRKWEREQTAAEELKDNPLPKPQVLIKRECAHRECSGLSKCKQSYRIGGIDT
jgi:hypothetical protein